MNDADINILPDSRPTFFRYKIVLGNLKNHNDTFFAVVLYMSVAVYFRLKVKE